MDEVPAGPDAGVPPSLDPSPVAASESLDAEARQDTASGSAEAASASPVPTPPPPPAAVREVVYVQAPIPPPARHNRGFGVVIALLGGAAFALLYIGAAALVVMFTPFTHVESTFAAFLTSDALWVPVVSYAVLAVVFALVADRASWWVHVLGSAGVAVLTYAAAVGVLALLRNVVGMTRHDGLLLLADLATHALLLCVLVLARECAMWFGLAISARGRRVRESNIAAKAEFERSVAERRAEYERAHPAV